MNSIVLHLASGAIPRFSSFYGSGSGGIYLDHVSCSGNEQALINCSHRSVGVHNCSHSEDAGVMCLGKLVYSASPFCIIISLSLILQPICHMHELHDNNYGNC